VERVTEVIRQLEKVLPHWKSYGAVSTPAEVVQAMIRLSGVDKGRNLDILEPACGFCNFLIEIARQFPDNRFVGVEINDDVYEEIAELPFEILHEDFLLWEPKQKFDLVIGNPPYGIIGAQEHYSIHTLTHKKAKYKRIFATWFGKYNMYGAFIEKGVRLLREGGKLVYIVPATWMILDVFAKLRKFLAERGHVDVYYLGPKVFPGITVTSCIIVFTDSGAGADLFIRNGEDFAMVCCRDKWSGEMLTFETEETRGLPEGKLRVGDVFDVMIAARSPEVRSCDAVLREPTGSALPFMKGKNVRRGYIDRTNYTGCWMRQEDIGKLKDFYGVLPRIVVGHTKGGEVVAALEQERYPYTGDVYHLLPRQAMTLLELKEIADWLNSAEINEYMRTLYRDITPHLTAKQLKLIPIPFEGSRLIHV